MNKRDVERICRAAKLQPVARDVIEGHEVFIADGFLTPSDIKLRRRFELDPLLYPWGCYETSWWAAQGEDKLNFGHIFWCDAFHDPGLTKDGKQLARIARARNDAREHLRRKSNAGH